MHLLDAIRGFLAWDWVSILAFLFVITVVVFFHELGHFLVGRWCGVKVDVFSVGFGREIVGFTDGRGTRWKLGWIPVGGYVKFAGDADAASTPDHEAVAHMSAEERAQALPYKPLAQRAAVAAAGPAANFVLAIVLLTGLLLYSGHTVISPLIGVVGQGSPAATAGMKPGDLVTSIDGTKITDFEQLPRIITISGGQTLAFGIRRDGRDMVLNVTPRLTTTTDVFGNRTEQVMIGVGPSRDAKVSVEHYGPLGAVVAASEETWGITRATILGIAQILGGHGSVDQLRGPVGIAQMTGEVAAFGFLALLNLVAVLSVSIGLANLFPIPLLDGGHLLYYGFEAVLGRPLGARAQEVGFRLGLVLVLGLMLLSTWNDLARLNLF